MTQRSLPPVQVVVRRPDRSMAIVTVSGLTDSDRVADLAAAVGLPVEDQLVIDGTVVGVRQRLIAAGVRRGSLIEPATPTREPAADSDTPASVATMEWCAGPDSGRRVAVGIGRHLLGRRRAVPLTARDPRLATHHGLVVVDRPTGGGVAVAYQDLNGVGSVVDGTPVNGTVPLAAGAHLRVGSSLLRVVGAEVTASRRTASTRPVTTWIEPLVRAPRRFPAAESTVVELPEPVSPASGEPTGPGAMSLVTAGLSLVGGLVMMLLFRQALMAIMALVGALTAVVTWSVQTVRARRARRRLQRATADWSVQIDAILATGRMSEAARLAAIRGLPYALAVVEHGAGLWERRLGDPDALEVSLGVGRRRWQPTPVGCETARPLGQHDQVAMAMAALAPIEHVAITTRLQTGSALGVVGPEAMRGALARSLVLQLVAGHGPADIELIVVTPAVRHAAWSWTGWLAHNLGDEGTPLCGPSAEIDEWALARLSVPSDGSPPVMTPVPRVAVVVVDDPTVLASRTAPLRRLLGSGYPVSLLVLADDLRDLPSMCTEAVEVTDDAVAVRHRWNAVAPTAGTGLFGMATDSATGEGGGPGERFRIAGASVESATNAARRMARFDDPERVNQLGSLPAALALDALLGDRAATPSSIVAGWEAAGSDPAPRALIGVAADGTVELDLRRDGPHALIGGTTGAGKSELLRTLVAALAVASPPDLLSFVLIDYKGGAAFDACARLPHVVGIVTDLDDRLASRVLVSLDAELRRREHLLRDAGASDLAGYRAHGTRQAIPRLVVVVDEFAALATELPEFLGSLVAIAQRGRSLGVHMVLATQRPNGVINDDIRANTNLRIALRVQDRADAIDVVGDPIAASLSRNRPGSAVVRLDATELTVFQTARCTGPVEGDGSGGAAGPIGGAMTALDALVDRLVRAAALRGAAAPRRPWLDPLPAVIAAGSAPDDLDSGSFGLIDVPESQSRRSLQWNRSAGHLLLAGSVGTGTTTALVTVATTLTADAPVSALHLYVVDAVGGGRLDRLADLPHCAGVVGASEPERRSRLLRRLADEVSRRQSGTSVVGREAEIVLVVDGLATLRSALDTAAGQVDADRLAMILQDGPRVGVVMATAVDRPGDVPAAVAARASARWLFGLTDPLEAAIWGVAARSTVALGRPGRCLVVDTGHEAQIVLTSDDTATTDRSRPSTLGGPAPLGSLPTTITLDELLDRRPDQSAADGWRRDGEVEVEGSLRLPIGIGVATLDPLMVEIHDGEHLLVAGPARSGRSTALATVIDAWRRARPDGWIGLIRPRRGAALGGCQPDVEGPLAEVVQHALANADRPRLLVVDDAELVDDDGSLQALMAGSPAGLLVVAAGRPDALRAAYGHWTGLVRRARKGVLLGAIHDLDADVLGVMLPRHRPTHAPTGRGYLIADGVAEAMQVALPSARRLRCVA